MKAVKGDATEVAKLWAWQPRLGVNRWHSMGDEAGHGAALALLRRTRGGRRLRVGPADQQKRGVIRFFIFL